MSFKRLLQIAAKGFESPFTVDGYTYATDHYIIARIKGAYVEQKEPPVYLNKLNWGIFDTLKAGQKIYKKDAVCVEKIRKRCTECKGEKFVYYNNDFHEYAWECKTCNGKGVEETQLFWKMTDILYCSFNHIDFMTEVLGDIEYFADDTMEEIPFLFSGGQGFIVAYKFSDDEVLEPYKQLCLFNRKKIYAKRIKLMMMDIKDAEKKVREHLAKAISITFIEDTRGIALYNFNSEKEYLFSYSLSEQFHVGGANYIAISKKTGEERYMGFLCE
jgi:hypothetical protein